MIRFLEIQLMTACVALSSMLTISTRPTPPPPPSPPVSAFVTPVVKITPWDSGVASWYGEVLEGHRTASGEIFEKDDMTAAHRTLPFGTVVRVTDTKSGKSVDVRINDRGVLSPEKVIDLSSGAAEKLGILRAGVAKVKIQVLSRARGKQSVSASAGNPA